MNCKRVLLILRLPPGEKVSVKVGGTRRQYTNKNGKSGHVSPAIVEKYLAGRHYPSGRKDLLENAKSKEAPEEVLNLLNKLPDKTYNSPIDITKEIGKIK